MSRHWTATRVGQVVGVIGLLIVLTACATSLEVVESTARPSTTPSPTPTPEPRKPALSELVVSPDGIGPLVIGAAPTVTDPALDVVVYDPDHCVEEGYEFPGMWLANYEDEPNGAPFAVSTNDQNIIDRMDVRSPEITTAEGIHRGSTHADLLAAYPEGFAEVQDKGGLIVYVLDGAHGQLQIEVATRDPDIPWEEAQIDVVQVMRVELPETRTYSISFTDNGIGFCWPM